MPPKRFFAWGREANYKTRYNMHESHLYRSSDAPPGFITIPGFAAEEKPEQKAE